MDHYKYLWGNIKYFVLNNHFKRKVSKDLILLFAIENTKFAKLDQHKALRTLCFYKTRYV
ncbi:hypothetical protein C8C83_1265 [Flavobacterium sp. 90]|nr:hypothetical protein C8C82_1566 [Flavobacterium sp. 81]TCK53407.1 hypothetical protein C8C83_1265 [Flavobacterium sp. 90]